MCSNAATLRLVARLLVLSLFAALHGPARARADADDPWLGRDKALHAGLSAGIAAGGYALSVPLVRPRPARAACGIALSLTLGAAKELYDLAGHGDPSARDFTWDVVGALTGAGVATLIDFAVQRVRARLARRRGPQPAPSGTRADLTVTGLRF